MKTGDFYRSLQTLGRTRNFVYCAVKLFADTDVEADSSRSEMRIMFTAENSFNLCIGL